jgi:hypothetical protein
MIRLRTRKRLRRKKDRNKKKAEKKMVVTHPSEEGKPVN